MFVEKSGVDTEIAGAQAIDVAVGAEGSVFIVTYSPSQATDSKVQRYTGGIFTDITTIADPRAIAADHKGNPWVTDLNGNVYKHDGASWNEEAVAGLDAADVATTPANRSWIVDIYGFIKELPFPERIHLVNAFHTARLPTSLASNPTSSSKLLQKSPTCQT